MAEKMIEFRNVVKRFDDRAVLDGMTFSVEKGEILAVIGPSGTGKSVTLKHVVGLLEPDEGEVVVNSDRIGYLFQSGALLAWKTVWENVALPLVEATKAKAAEIEERVAFALNAVGLADAADRYPAEISGGMQKRAGLARAIVCDAEVILYDEPTSGLDPVTAAQITRLIRDINRKRGVTSVVVTHDLFSAFRIAHRVLLVKGGKAVACLTPDDFQKSTDPEVREFLSASRGDGL
jgi:phospholipid/cholesterol/gamma-HCH transport system ATP-binding protein